jgi:hypothetical protein
MQSIVNVVQSIFTQGKFNYVLSQYVDVSIWHKRFANLFSNNCVENFTDFNYSRCFTVFVNVSNTQAQVGTKEFSDYVRNNGILYRIMVQVSALAPYATYQYLKYENVDGEAKLSGSYRPFNEEMSLIGEKLERYFKQVNHFVLDEQSLSIQIPGVSLELNSDGVTVYNCLFDD